MATIEKEKALDVVRQMVEDGQISQEVAEKYFPELKESEESEDEKIRKAIHIYLDWLDGRKDYAPKGEYTIRDMIAWLDRQGKHQKFRDSIQVGDKVTRNEDGVLVNLSQLNRVAKKQSEQKSFARYKVGDTIYYDSFGRLVSFTIANIVEDGTDNPMYEDKEGNAVFEKDLIEHKSVEVRTTGYWNVQDIEQKPAWSEEDELIVAKILCICDDFERSFECSPSSTKVIKEDVDKIDTWLKSLKDRVQPQPNKEWSEEDEENFKKAIKVLKVTNFHHIADILQEMKYKLIPREETNNWKPSDEQMNALNYVVNLMASSERPTENDLYYNILKSLRQQLKKLKG